MKKLINAYAMTQSMFCSLPFPFKRWDEEARSYMLLFLPVVGLEIGFVWVLAHFIQQYLELPNMIYGLVMCAIPYLMSGFIHLDGFLDVTDAISSWRPLEKRRAILKDSQVGAFAAIWCVFLILSVFVCFASVSASVNVWPLLVVPVVSRCCSSIAVMNLKPMETSQYINSKTYPRWPSYILLMLLIACLVVEFAVFGKYGFVVLAGLIGYMVPLRKSYRLLEGMNGDIAGYCLSISELCAVIVWALL